MALASGSARLKGAFRAAAPNSILVTNVHARRARRVRGDRLYGGNGEVIRSADSRGRDRRNRAHVCLDSNRRSQVLGLQRP